MTFTRILMASVLSSSLVLPAATASADRWHGKSWGKPHTRYIEPRHDNRHHKGHLRENRHERRHGRHHQRYKRGFDGDIAAFVITGAVLGGLLAVLSHEDRRNRD